MANAGFYIFETETLKIKMEPETALSGYKDIVVSISQKGRAQIDISTDALIVDEFVGTIEFHLDQTQTAEFRPGMAMIQVNIYFADHERDTTVMDTITVYDNLYKKVMV